MIRVGFLIKEYCHPFNSNWDKRVEAIGYDWIVVRDEQGSLEFYEGDIEDLEKSLKDHGKGVTQEYD